MNLTLFGLPRKSRLPAAHHVLIDPHARLTATISVCLSGVHLSPPRYAVRAAPLSPNTRDAFRSFRSFRRQLPCLRTERFRYLLMLIYLYFPLSSLKPFWIAYLYCYSRVAFTTSVFLDGIGSANACTLTHTHSHIQPEAHRRLRPCQVRDLQVPSGARARWPCAGSDRASAA